MDKSSGANEAARLLALARARTLTPERRHEIAVLGGRASAIRRGQRCEVPPAPPPAASPKPLDASEFGRLLSKGQRLPKGWLTLCPGCGLLTLMLTLDDCGAVVLHCGMGCKPSAVLEALRRGAPRL